MRPPQASSLSVTGAPSPGRNGRQHLLLPRMHSESVGQVFSRFFKTKTKKNLFFFHNPAWPQYKIEDNEAWPESGNLTYHAILPLDIFAKGRENRHKFLMFRLLWPQERTWSYTSPMLGNFASLHPCRLNRSLLSWHSWRNTSLRQKTQAPTLLHHLQPFPHTVSLFPHLNRSAARASRRGRQASGNCQSPYPFFFV